MRGLTRAGCLALLLLLVAATRASAEWQLRPFVGVTFGGGTTLVDLDHAAGRPNIAVGIGGVWLGDIVGLDVDLGYAPGFFQTGNQRLVLRSSVTTLTGNIVIAVPRRLTEYSLRPYFVGGGGVMRARSDDFFGVLRVASALPAVDLGGGVTGFLTDRIGVNWDVRCFRSLAGAPEGRGLSLGAEKLSFWRANVALAIRY